MRLKHIKRLGPVLGIQWVLLAAMVRFEGGIHWLAGVSALLSILVPYGANVWALQDAPLGAKTSRVVKAAVLALVSFGMTLAGWTAGYVIFSMCGFPVRGG